MNDLEKRIFGNELKYVTEVLESEFKSSKGSVMMKRLEEAFATRFGVKHALSFVNGTATMHCVLEAIGISPGDEIIVPPLTMASTAFVVLQANATPIFADVDPNTWLIDPASIFSKITPRTKAIITVALYGLSPDMDAIMNIAKNHNLFVLEDNAQCFLGTYKGRIAGSVGHAASFSFQSSKHLTSGEGGMITTNDSALAEKVRKICSLGYAGVSASKGKITKIDIQDPNYSRHVMLGWNYRMPELCSAVALAQVENIDALVARRIENAAQFNAIVKECSWLIPQQVGTDYTHSYWTYVVRLDHPTVTWHQFRDKYLESGGDGVYAAWQLTYLEPMFQNLNLLGREKFISAENKSLYQKGACPVAESLQPKLIQFKTNYWNPEMAAPKLEALKKTIAFFNQSA